MTPDSQETTEYNLPDDDSADLSDDELNNNENLANVSKYRKNDSLK